VSKPAHPMQPVVLDASGVARFRENAIVKYLLEWASARGCNMNDLAIIPFAREDREQFAQLIGYSVSGAGDLSYMGAKTIAAADAAVEALLEKDGK
jgi:hypothetical protein